MRFGKAWLGVLALVAVASGVRPVTAEQAAPDATSFLTAPAWRGPLWVEASEWASLEQMVESLAASRERADDGQLQLYKLTNSIHSYFLGKPETRDPLYRTRLADYQQQYPKSAFAPVVSAMQLHAAAWRARGHGFSSTVTSEGASLFRERNKDAWKIIRAAKTKSDRLPVWYEQALSIGLDADAPPEELAAIFKEGVQRFGDYDPIYYSFIRQFAPRWGGSYEEADAFISAQVAAKTNPKGEELYTRLYWLIDDYEAGSPEFFEESLVDWSRMKKGFEMLVKEFPKSTVYPAAFAAYACRAGDAVTYFKVRQTVSPQAFVDEAPQGISLDVCDARFTEKT